jgi:hypothetical protein
MRRKSRKKRCESNYPASTRPSGVARAKPIRVNGEQSLASDGGSNPATSSLCARQRLGLRQPSAAFPVRRAFQSGRGLPQSKTCRGGRKSNFFPQVWSVGNVQSRGQPFAVGLVVAVPAAQGGVAGVGKKKFQRRRFNVAVAKD